MFEKCTLDLEKAPKHATDKVNKSYVEQNGHKTTIDR